MTIEVWPFLVSRNRYLDYRTVVAPDFICKAKTGNLLARVTTGDLTEPGKGFIRQIFGSKVGDFTIVYRILEATQKDLNYQVGDEILKDQFGREILLIEGVVIQEIKSQENVLISQKNMEEIHHKLTEGYTEFWEHRDPHPAIPSDKLSLSMDGLELEEIEKFKIDSKPPISPVSLSALLSPKFSIRLLYPLAFIFIIIMAVLFFLPSMPSIDLYQLYQPKVYYCTTTEEKNIRFDSKNDIDDVLKKERKKYPNAAIFLNGYLILESNEKWEILTKREELNESINYTINLVNGNILKLQDHPLDLAIVQLRNQKIGDISELQDYIKNLADAKLAKQEVKDYIKNLADAKLAKQEVGEILELQDPALDFRNPQPPNQQAEDTSKSKDDIKDLKNAQLLNQEVEDILKLQDSLLNLAIPQSDNQETLTIKAKIINRKNKKECQSNS